MPALDKHDDLLGRSRHPLVAEDRSEFLCGKEVQVSQITRIYSVFKEERAQDWKEERERKMS